MVADGDQAGGEQADAALGAGKEVLAHLVVGTAGFFRHLAVAHGRHNKAVFDGQPVDLNGRESGVIGPELFGVAPGAHLLVLAVFLHPVAVAVYESFDQCIRFQSVSSLSEYLNKGWICLFVVLTLH